MQAFYGTLYAPIFSSGGSIKIDAGAAYSKVAIWDKHENKSIKKNTGTVYNKD